MTPDDGVTRSSARHVTAAARVGRVVTVRHERRHSGPVTETPLGSKQGGLVFVESEVRCVRRNYSCRETRIVFVLKCFDTFALD